MTRIIEDRLPHLQMTAMTMRPKSSKPITRALILTLGSTALTLALAADPPAHLRGTVVSARPDSLTVKTSQGTFSVSFDSTTKIAGIIPSNTGEIKEGTFVGIANMPGATTSSALEVVVFPDSMKGFGAGDSPWDLLPAAMPSTAGTSAMTNGTVKSSTTADSVAPMSAMTNGTVTKTSGSDAMTLIVDYGKGEKTIVVPQGIPVVTVVPADASKLVAGAHVFVAVKKDAPTSAGYIAVGIDGTVPPM
jgi:hypothetical protein